MGKTDLRWELEDQHWRWLDQVGSMRETGAYGQAGQKGDVKKDENSDAPPRRRR